MGPTDAFASAQYGRPRVAPDQTALDQALSSASSAASQARAEHSWLKDALRQWRAVLTSLPFCIVN